MDKQISVHMRDDQLEYVEVDGVRYTDPEQIPDPDDRERVKAMLAPAEDGGQPGGALEQQFLREVRAMQRQPRIFPRLIQFIFLGVAAVLFVIGGVSTVNVLRQLGREQSAPGRVVELVVRPSVDSETGQVTYYAYPVLRFSPGGGTPITVQSSDGASPPAYSVGDQVTVLYDAQNPRQARVKSFASSLLLWLLPAVTFFVGGVFAVVALVMFRAWPARSQEN